MVLSSQPSVSGVHGNSEAERQNLTLKIMIMHVILKIFKTVRPFRIPWWKECT
jgi:hypothetical protein